MASTEEFIRTLKSSLEPYIKTREEVAFIRRILALHLESTLPETNFGPPLALVNIPTAPTPAPELRHLQREYILGLSANIKAQQGFDALRRAISAHNVEPDTPQPPRADLLSHHLTIAKLSQKLSRLETVQKHLDQMSSLPAASPDFLSQDSPEDDTATLLPAVPKSVISAVGLASAQRDVVRTDLNDLLNGLEKNVLRAKLTLKREEEALADAKAAFPVTKAPSATDLTARLQALTTTRNELIGWMETELSKVGDGMEEGGEAEMEEEEEADKPPPPTRTPGGRLHKGIAKVQERRRVEIKLREIREKYAQYIEGRKDLVGILQKPPAPPSATSFKDGTTDIFTGKPDLQHPKSRSHQSHAATASISSSSTQPPQPPQAHLLTPYLSALLSLSREQKSLIQQKSHINVHLSHAARDCASCMDHMAEESQLLPRFPVPQQLQRLAALDGGLGMSTAARSSPGAETLLKAKGWRHAAAEAKIATLENVAEKVEEAQLALESARGVLDEADDLLGVERKGEKKEEEEEEEEKGEDGEGGRGDDDADIWLLEQDNTAEVKGAKSGFGFGEQRRGKQTPPVAKIKTEPEKYDVWARLDGNLGGLNSP